MSCCIALQFFAYLMCTTNFAFSFDTEILYTYKYVCIHIYPHTVLTVFENQDICVEFHLCNCSSDMLASRNRNGGDTR